MNLLAPESQEIFFIGPEEIQERIDKLLATRYPLFSRTYFQKLLESGLVLVNGLPVKKRILAEEGDEIEVCFQLPPESSLEPEEIPLSILYEDEHLLAVDKPHGLVVHPAPGHPRGTFVNALLAHCKTLAHDGTLRPGIVHRLDKDTSGVLLAAKTPIAHERMVDLFASRNVEKTYLAICLGNPGNQVVSAPIGRHPTRRKEMAVDAEKGKEAVSAISTLAYNHELSLVLIRPKTGRTHQIRVHLQHIGCPVLGDSLYGSDRANRAHGAVRQLLHAYQTRFNHPITGNPLATTAPIPSDIKAAIAKIGQNLEIL